MFTELESAILASMERTPSSLLTVVREFVGPRCQYYIDAELDARANAPEPTEEELAQWQGRMEIRANCQ